MNEKKQIDALRELTALRTKLAADAQRLIGLLDNWRYSIRTALEEEGFDAEALDDVLWALTKLANVRVATTGGEEQQS